MSLETFVGAVDPDRLKLTEKDKIFLGKYHDYSGMKPDEDLMASFARSRYQLTSTEEDYMSSERARTNFLLSSNFVLSLDTTKWGTIRQIRDFPDGRRFTIEISRDFEIKRITLWVALKVREFCNGISSGNVVTWQSPDRNIVAEQVSTGKACSLETVYNLPKIGPSTERDIRPLAKNNYLQTILDNQVITREARLQLRGRLKI